MRLSKSRPLFFLPLFFLFVNSCWGSPSSPDWQGSWEGTMFSGPNRMRIALNLNPGRLEFDNIDDGIYGEPLKILSPEAADIKIQTSGGGKMDLTYEKEKGGMLAGTYSQDSGRDSQLSLIGLNKSYLVVLKRGKDYLAPRLSPDGGSVTEYHYQPPAKMMDGWERGDLREGPSSISKIEKGIQNILNGRFPNIHGLVLVKDDKLVLDEYFYGYGPGDPHPVQSITKSVFSLLFGIGMKQNLLQPGQRLYDFFPSYRSKPGWDPRKDQIQLQSLLDMTSGLGCDDFKDSKDCSWAMVGSDNWLDYSLSLPLGNDPGSRFAYCGASLLPLGAILEKQGGMTLPDYARKFLFEPVGIKEPSWWEGPGGIHSPAFGLYLRPRDLAKIGLLVLKKGKWNGRPLVPEDWIEESTNPKAPGRMHDLWWRKGMTVHGRKFQVAYAQGVGGQYLFIIPEMNLVCVLTGGNYKNPKLGAQGLKFFQNYILAAF